LVKRIIGKEKWQGIKQLETNGNKITNINEVANILAKTISKHSASSNYTKIVQEQKTKIEIKPLHFNSLNSELLYNKPFSSAS